MQVCVCESYFESCMTHFETIRGNFPENKANFRYRSYKCSINLESMLRHPVDTIPPTKLHKPKVRYASSNVA